MAANTAYTGTFATPIVIPSTGVYYVALCITGTTIPTLLGKTNATVAAQHAALNAFGWAAGSATVGGYCVTSTGAASTAPATMASFTQLIVNPWVCLQ
jgi:hypothetical protein